MSHRPPWSSLPLLIHEWVGEVLGAPVVTAIGQAGGFSPASADRVVAANGQRAFVKAVHVVQNAFTTDMHRVEARVAAAFPRGLPAPTLLGCLDQDGWVALAFADIDGRHPQIPWDADELEATLRSLDELAAAVTPPPLPDLPDLPAVIRDDFDGWTRVAADPPADVDPWLVASLPELTARAATGVIALAGNTLVHTDIRADNLLIDRDGRVWVVDWPWACRGAAWADALLLLASAVDHTNLANIDVRVDLVLAEHGVSPQVGTDVLSGFVSFFVDAARLPDPAGLGPVQEHRRRRAAYTMPLLRKRIEAEATGARS